MSDNGHILVVDDQKEICDVVQEYLTGEGYRVATAHDGAGMRRCMARIAVDLVILDLMLPGEDGLTLARALRERIRISASSSSPAAARPSTASSASRWAPTTICRSRSICASCWRG